MIIMKFHIKIPPVNIIPPILPTRLQRHVTPTRRTKAQNLETFRKAILLGKSGNKWTEQCLVFKGPIVCTFYRAISVLFPSV